MSVDPYMRGRMNAAKSYAAPYEIGKALWGGAVGEVVASRDAAFAEGDVVLHQLGWREYTRLAAKHARKVDAAGVPASAFLGVLGMPGLTAYVGLLDIAELREGDVVFVSGAAGAVGSVAGQLAKLRGHTVIGSAGSPEKVAHLLERPRVRQRVRLPRRRQGRSSRRRRRTASTSTSTTSAATTSRPPSRSSTTTAARPCAARSRPTTRPRRHPARTTCSRSSPSG